MGDMLVSYKRQHNDIELFEDIAVSNKRQCIDQNKTIQNEHQDDEIEIMEVEQIEQIVTIQIEFPKEIIMEIFYHLSCRDLLKMRTISKEWNGITQLDNIWANLFAGTFGGNPKKIAQRKEVDFKKLHLEFNNFPNAVSHELLQWCIRHHCNKLFKENIIKCQKPYPHNASTPLLYLASVRGNTEIVQILLSDGYSDPNYAHNGDSSPLYVACQENHLDTVKILVANGADIEFKFREGFTPLYVASQRGNIDIVNLLINYFYYNAKHKTGYLLGLHITVCITIGVLLSIRQ